MDTKSQQPENYQQTLTEEDLKNTQPESYKLGVFDTSDSTNMPIVQPTSEDKSDSAKLQTTAKPVKKATQSNVKKTTSTSTKRTSSSSRRAKTTTKTLNDKLMDIQLLVLDVDGVLTDGSIYITDEGSGLKRFYSQDGHGLKMLRNSGIRIMFLSARKCKATRKRGRELGVSEIHLGIADKKAFLTRFLQSHSLQPYKVAYMGDDLVDLPAMKLCGVKIMPANGVKVMAELMDYVTVAHGGNGAVREVCDMILIARSAYEQYLT